MEFRPVEDAGGGRIAFDEVVAVAGVEGGVAAIETEAVHGVVAAVVVLGDDAFGGAGVAFELLPGGFGDAAGGVAEAPAIDEELFVGVEDVGFLAGGALIGLDHAADGHAGEEAEPFKERFPLGGFRGALDAGDAHDVGGPFGEQRRAQASLLRTSAVAAGWAAAARVAGERASGQRKRWWRWSWNAW